MRDTLILVTSVDYESPLFKMRDTLFPVPRRKTGRIASTVSAVSTRASRQSPPPDDSLSSCEGREPLAWALDGVPGKIEGEPRRRNEQARPPAAGPLDEAPQEREGRHRQRVPQKPQVDRPRTSVTQPRGKSDRRSRKEHEAQEEHRPRPPVPRRLRARECFGRSRRVVERLDSHWFDSSEELVDGVARASFLPTDTRSCLFDCRSRE